MTTRQHSNVCKMMRGYTKITKIFLSATKYVIGFSRDFYFCYLQHSFQAALRSCAKGRTLKKENKIITFKEYLLNLPFCWYPFFLRRLSDEITLNPPKRCVSLLTHFKDDQYRGAVVLFFGMLCRNSKNVSSLSGRGEGAIASQLLGIQ